MNGEQREFTAGVGALFRITLPPVIWAFHFVICYGATAVWCARLSETGDTGPLRTALVVATVLALAGIAFSGVHGWRTWTAGGHGEDGTRPGLDDEESRERFLGHATVLLTVVSTIGVVYVILPVLLIGSCR